MSSLIALAVIGAYRLIPCRVRRVWSFGKSTSHLALAAARNGEGFSSFRYARFGLHGQYGDRGWVA
jgi:hypothetical protein